MINFNRRDMLVSLPISILTLTFGRIFGSRKTTDLFLVSIDLVDGASFGGDSNHRLPPKEESQVLHEETYDTPLLSSDTRQVPFHMSEMDIDSASPEKREMI